MREPLMLSLEAKQLERVLEKAGSEQILVDLNLTSSGVSAIHPAMLKELQTDHVSDSIIHADFYEISLDKEIEIEVPVRLVNTPVGVKNGGVLEHVKREIVVSCLPDNAIGFLELDVGALEMGQSLHIKDIVLPQGIKAVEDPDITVAVVSAPHAAAPEKAAAEEGEEAAEPVEEKEES
jgi:large subunit ribosomal protein L25